MRDDRVKVGQEVRFIFGGAEQVGQVIAQTEFDTPLQYAVQASCFAEGMALVDTLLIGTYQIADGYQLATQWAWVSIDSLILDNGSNYE